MTSTTDTRQPPTLAFATPEAYRRNMRALTRFAGFDGAEEDLDLKRAYVDALDKVQGDRIARPIESDPVVHFWEPNATVFPGFHDHFLESTDRSQAVVVPAAERPSIEAAISEALGMLDDYRADYAQLARDLVAAVVCVRRADLLSATVSSHLGTVLLHPLPEAQPVFFAEALLHEAIHQAQFLDEMVTGWYAMDHAELDREEALVISPIRRVRRPLNLTFNAVGVAAVLLDFLWWVGDRERAQDMCKPLLLSLTELKERERFLTERGREVLDSTAEVCAGSAAFAHA